MKEPKIDCPYCKGSGKTSIPLSFTETWLALSGRTWATSDVIAKALGLTTEGALGRLQRMSKAGLVERRKVSKPLAPNARYEWRRAGL